MRDSLPCGMAVEVAKSVCLCIVAERGMVWHGGAWYGMGPGSQAIERDKG